jgi:hypothetical protein
MTKQALKQKQRASEPSSSSLSLDGGPRDAMHKTGRSPEPDNKLAKRTATKRRLTTKAVDDR